MDATFLVLGAGILAGSWRRVDDVPRDGMAADAGARHFGQLLVEPVGIARRQLEAPEQREPEDRALGDDAVDEDVTEDRHVARPVHVAALALAVVEAFELPCDERQVELEADPRRELIAEDHLCDHAVERLVVRVRDLVTVVLLRAVVRVLHREAGSEAGAARNLDYRAKTESPAAPWSAQCLSAG